MNGNVGPDLETLALQYEETLVNTQGFLIGFCTFLLGPRPRPCTGGVKASGAFVFLWAPRPRYRFGTTVDAPLLDQDHSGTPK